MGLFDFLAKGNKTTPSAEATPEASETCPSCLEPTVSDSENTPYCDDCADDADAASISVYDAAEIWASNGKDEDYMFGFSREELESVL